MKEMARATDDSKKTFLKEVDFWIHVHCIYIHVHVHGIHVHCTLATCTCMLEIWRRERHRRRVCSTCAFRCILLDDNFQLFYLPVSKVQLLKSLHHPNILQFIGILYKEGKVLVLITEYADGGTLRKTIKNTERLFPWYLRISITRDIAAGMVRGWESMYYVCVHLHQIKYHVKYALLCLLYLSSCYIHVCTYTLPVNRSPI